MKLANIKRRWLRRIVMVLAFPFVAVEYMVRGLITLFYDARSCWNYEHPEA